LNAERNSRDKSIKTWLIAASYIPVPMLRKSFPNLFVYSKEAIDVYKMLIEVNWDEIEKRF
jgi:hypothetical protein